MILNFFERLALFNLVCSSIFLTCSSQINKNVGGTGFLTDMSSTGVLFSPYVRHFDEGIDAYSESDVVTMLQVIRERYTHIITRPWFEVPQGERKSPVFQSIGHIPIAGAKQNRKRVRSQAPFNVAITVDAEESNRMFENMESALRLASAANNIYNGTVSTLLLFTENIQNANNQESLIHVMNTTRNRSVVLHQQLRIGIWMHLTECGTSTKLITLPMYTRNILGHADVVIFYSNPTDTQNAAGPQKGSESMIEDFRSCEERIRASFNNSYKLKILWATSWPSDGGDGYSISNSVTYWKLVSKWASQNKQFVYFSEAFDEPFQQASLANLGWWKLKRKDIRNITKSAFVEKILEDVRELVEEKENKENLNHWSFSTVFAMGLFSGGFVFLIIAGAAFLLYRNFSKFQTPRLTCKDCDEFMKGCSGESDSNAASTDSKNMELLRLPYDKERLELEKSSFTIDFSALLGKGAFGSVYRGRVNGMSSDAAFKLTQPSCPVSTLKGLLSEIKVLGYLSKHEHIVSLVGAYTAELRNGIVYVVLELCEVGSLEVFLRAQQLTFSNDYAYGTMTMQSSSRTRPYQPGEFRGKADMLRWSYEICAGMEYMTSMQVVHADLATRNVLLTSTLQAKISDFGLSRRLYDYTNYVKKQQEPLPWRWMSIEALKCLEFSEKSDVWAFACTMWEIYTLGDTPYPGLSWSLDFVTQLQNGFRLQCPQYATQQLYNLMLECWHTNPKDRASFTKLKNALMGLYCRDKLQG